MIIKKILFHIIINRVQQLFKNALEIKKKKKTKALHFFPVLERY